FIAENSHTELLFSGTKIIVQEQVLVNASIENQSSQEVFWISSGVPTNQVQTGQFGHTNKAQRTATCGNEPGETPFTIEAIVISDYNGKDISCNGAEDGEAFVTISGGIGPFTFSWVGADNTAATQNFSNLGPGTYTILVTDMGQNIICIDEVGIVEPSPITLGFFSQTPPSCAGLCNGTAVAVVSGGTPGHTLVWSSGDSGTNASMICEGPNTFVATDLNGYTLTEEFTSILEPIVANVDITNVVCNGTATGAAVSNPSGGQEPYFFSWSTAADIDNSIDSQIAGMVTLTITDDSGCSIDTTFEITEEPPVQIVLNDSQDESCEGASDGFIEVDISGGTPDYLTTWTSDLGYSSFDEDIFGLPADNYTLVVEDDNGCLQTFQFTISAPPAIQVDADLTHVSCFNGSNGAIELSISGGTPDYSIVWDDGFGSNALIDNLPVGSYSATITDENDCEVEVSYDLDQPDEIIVLGVISPISCFGDNNGAIEVSISGGTPDYSTSWTGPAFVSFDEDISDLAAGTYNLQVIDDLGCTGQFSGEIIEPETMDISTLVEPISCPGANDASIETNVLGGTPDYLFDWTGPNGFTSADQNIFDLEPGPYDLVVTDSEGCTVETTVVLNDPDPLVIVPNVTNVSCGGLSDGEIDLSVLGGTPDYSYDWTGPNGFTSDQEDLLDLEAGTYTVSITDLEGCSTDLDIDVTETPELEVTINTTEITCFGEDDASIDLEIAGGQPNYDVNWSGPNLF
ncbi:MAG: SprB repeat-containing protein, partial [Flavobacteriales bacterium]